ncbi:MAG: EVE domain-containing protein, partial [Candidatus Competibacteraceae bacterium]|nr:EVE domain-containing protein [Candidatus Competibacteraceae bacterium]
MNYWLLKSEPSVFSIDDLAVAPTQTTFWEGVRNYQARNLLRDR